MLLQFKQRLKPAQPKVGIYVVKAGDRTLYVGRNFNPDQSWVNDADYHRMMGWNNVEVKVQQYPLNRVDKIEAKLIKKLKPEIRNSKREANNYLETNLPF